MALISKSILRGNTTVENIAVLNHFDIHKLSIYIKTTEEVTVRRMFFSTATENWIKHRGGGMECLFGKIRHFYVTIVITSLYFVLISLRYK